MTYSFRTNGDYIDFVHTDNTSLQVENVLKSLHNTSRCITWGLEEDTTRISFVVDRISCSNILITEIDFDGTPMNSQDDFETGIIAMFPGLEGGDSPGGGSSPLIAKLAVTQAGTSPLTVFELQNTIGTIVSSGGSGGNEGNYKLTFTGALTGKRIWISGFGDWAGDANVYLPLHDGDAVVGYLNMYPNEPADEILIEVKDSGGVFTNLSTLAGTTKFYLPEINVFPAE